MSEKMVRELAEHVGGTIEEMERLPDGSGFAVMSMPLLENHWLTADPDGFNVPPMPIRLDVEQTLQIFRAGRGTIVSRGLFAEWLAQAARYAIRASTMNGKDEDFDPDAMVQNFIIGMLGYYTPDGLSSDEWASKPKDLAAR